MLVLLIAMGVAALAAAGARRSPAPAPASVSPAIAAGAPSPLLVLDGILRQGQHPPPQVILCAIAEAELMDRMDVVEELVRAFILPTVLAARVEEARRAYPPIWDPRASSAICPPDGTGHPTGSPWAEPHETPSQNPQDSAQMQHPGYRPPRSPASAPAPRPPRPPIPIAREEDARVELFQREFPAILAPDEPPPGARGTITVSGLSSPIGGVPNEAWAAFVGRIAREQVTFTSPHHVGQFRQRRSRLAELGIDPGSVVGSPEAQTSALCADMRDAYRHATEAGLIAEYRGVAVEIPPSGQSPARPIEVTLSGVLGVIQAAGLEGAQGWLEDAQDRRRFPHTTQAFLRTNGLF